MSSQRFVVSVYAVLITAYHVQKVNTSTRSGRNLNPTSTITDNGNPIPEAIDHIADRTSKISEPINNIADQTGEISEPTNNITDPTSKISESVTKLYSHQNFTDTEAELLDILCPAVDICDLNATSADLEPNGIQRKGLVSCCNGCSCHKDCAEQHNCCYPGLDSDQYNYGNTRECLYTHVGSSAENILPTVPAYRTIVKEPNDGCLDSTPIKIGPGQVIYPTCNDDVLVPLASYMPVYSHTTGEIYENVLCARCHGVVNTIPFSSFLVCQGARGNPVTLSEQLYILETGVLPTYCSFEFEFHDRPMISNKRCYKNVVETCESNIINTPEDIGLNNMELDKEILTLCKSGVYAPTIIDGKVYRNVFCVLCGLTEFKELLCQADSDDRAGKYSLIHFLDNTRLLKKIAGPQETNDYHEACELDNNSKDQKNCRRIFCPSGEIRDREEKCVYISKSWRSGALLVQLKLTPESENTNVRTQIRQTGREEFHEALNIGKPWPNPWTVVSTAARLDDSNCSEKGELNLMITLDVEYLNIKDIHDEIDTAIKKPWLISINGSLVRFDQAFHDYRIANQIATGDYRVPLWESDLQYADVPNRYPDCLSIRWTTIFFNSSFRSTPFQVNKLILCEQIELDHTEFTLGDRNSFILSNLTSGVLYDFFDYDLIRVDSLIHVRVYLSDTLLSRRQAESACVKVTPEMIAPLLIVVLFYNLVY